jgi:mono/diheme cytochrome c family protein
VTLRAAAWAAACAGWLFVGGARAGDAAADGMRLFREKVQPVLEQHCYECHSAQAKKLRGGLRLDTRAGLRKGGDSGPAVVPGDAKNSPLIQAVRHEGDLAMPPKKLKLPDAVIADLVRWVDAGAPDPRGDEPVAEDARTFWAFQPIRQVAPPAVRGAGWCRTPVDRFILAKLEERGVHPAPPAPKAVLIRRLFFDLTGLPPTPEEVAAFLADESPDAYERLVNRLLDSPQFGERWAQHWLDVVRFAETEGYEYDRHVPDAWRFRDYVIKSFNEDKPFDRFVTEQVAGDEIAPDDPECRTASIFHRLGPVRRNAGNPEIALSRNEVLTERTDVIGAAFLGLTVGCARCHDHKIDPIPQKDYYRLQAYLAATDEHNILLAPAAARQEWEAKTKAINQQLAKLRKQAERATGQEKRRLEEQVTALEDSLPPPPPTVPATHNDAAHRTAIHVLKRGEWEKKGEPVGPRPLSVLVPPDTAELPADAAHPRTHLARWLTDARNPLPARVVVNRLWQHHFGQGLVKTPNDFGKNGGRPSHPELLDWLAAELVNNGWRLKPIHRLLLLSSAYQQSAVNPIAAEASKADPDNRLLWRSNRRHLSAEEVRDAMLAVAGRLNRKAGGPSVIVPVEPELVRFLYKPSQWAVTADAAEHDRRSVYLIAKRNLRLPFLETFDQPALQTSCGRRESSTHALQALELLNGKLANDLAGAFAARLKREAGGDSAREADRAYRLAVGRPPTAREAALAVAFLRGQPLKEFALALFNINGFLYVD